MIRSKVFEVGAGRGHWQGIGEAGIGIEDLGHEEGDPAGRLVARAVHEVALCFDARSLLNRLSEISLVGNLDDVLPYP